MVFHVVDASVLVQALLSREGLAPLAPFQLVAPRLLWSEATSALRELTWRREISRELALGGLQRLEAAPIAPHDLPGGPRSAYDLAARLGWAKTYDAEYVVLAVALDGVLMTSDMRLRRAVSHLVRVVGPTGV